MKTFTCSACGNFLTFETTHCLRCGTVQGYSPEAEHMIASPGERLCANHEHIGCNWLVPAGEGGSLCRACRLNRTIPDLSVPGNIERWALLEQAKRRLVYGLLRLYLPVVSGFDDPETGLVFDFLASTDNQMVMTGYGGGVISLNIAEADDVSREIARTQMVEPYRTVLGHFRHETGHYYRERLIRTGHGLEDFRALFGDERLDYAAALDDHHTNGPPADWPQCYVSAYAAAHPLEDFAETWAHYLHIVDTLETAAAFNLTVAPGRVPDAALDADVSFDAYHELDFDRLIATWLPVTYAVNSINRSMGLADLYPFVLSPAALEKIRFVHTLLKAPDTAHRR